MRYAVGGRMRYSYVPESHAAHELGEQRMPVAPYPVPEWTSRQPCPDAWIHPDPVLKLAETAREHEWGVEVRYSRGRMPHATTGNPLGLRHLVAVRIGSHPRTQRQAVAVYSSPAARAAWSWETIYVWGPDLPPFPHLNLSELRQWLAAGGQLTANWFREIGDVRAERVRAAKVAAKARVAEKGTGSRSRKEAGG